METMQIGNRRMLRLDPGEEVVRTIQSQLAEEGVGFAFLSAAGGVRSVELGYWDAATAAYRYQTFDEQLEVLVMQGNVSLKEEMPYLHLHAVFGRQDFTTLGGHVAAAEVNPTLEVWLRGEDVEVRRRKDSGSGLDVLDLARPRR